MTLEERAQEFLDEARESGPQLIVETLRDFARSELANAADLVELGAQQNDIMELMK